MGCTGVVGVINRGMEDIGNCIKPSASRAGENVKCHSDRSKADVFIAGIAIEDIREIKETSLLRRGDGNKDNNSKNTDYRHLFISLFRYTTCF